MAFRRIAFRASRTPVAQAAYRDLVGRYGDTPLETAQVIVAIGGDGFMLETLHDTLASGLPVFGIHRGTIGFLMNETFGPTESDLPRRLAEADPAVIHPLCMTAVDGLGGVHEALAINEVSLLRETRQTAKIRISIDGKERMSELICDGVLVSTPAGSTAYNLSAHGPILPIEARLLALTPISAFRPRRWRGAILPHRARVRFDVLEPDKRPVSAVADATEIRHVRSVEVAEDRSVSITLLFDRGHNLDERILMEQFYH
ncbi:MAG: NAD kinase [Alphaproteobacteria bacterium]